jgi:hypothetical protein
MSMASLFVITPFLAFNPEGQDFVPGLGEEDFQVEVPVGGALDQISLVDGRLHRERIHLQDWSVGTSYGVVPTATGFNVFMGSGVVFFQDNGAKQVWYRNLGSIEDPVVPQPDGTVAVLSGKEILRLHPEDGRTDVIAELDASMSDTRLYPLHEGYLAAWDADDSDQQAPCCRFYGFDGVSKPHPLVTAIHRLRQSAIQLPPPWLSLDSRSFHLSQTRDLWAIFPSDSLPQFPGKHLFLLSVTDTIQVAPISCDRYSLEQAYSLDFVIAHPRLNLFLVGAKNEVGGEVMLYLGRIRRVGGVLRAEAFRLRYFPEVVSPVFSRNGKVLLFSARMDNAVNLVFSRLEDLAADVNRRYPEAKFDLKELEGSPHGR